MSEEPSAAAAEAPASESGQPMTAEAAQVEIDRLSADPDFRKRLLGDPTTPAYRDANRNWEKLQSFAFGVTADGRGGEGDSGRASSSHPAEAYAVVKIAFNGDTVNFDKPDPEAAAEHEKTQSEVRSLVRDIGLEPEFAAGAIKVIDDAINNGPGTLDDPQGVAEQTQALLRGKWGSEFGTKLDRAMSMLDRAGDQKEYAITSLLLAGPVVYSWAMQQLELLAPELEGEASQPGAAT